MVWGVNLHSFKTVDRVPNRALYFQGFEEQGMRGPARKPTKLRLAEGRISIIYETFMVKHGIISIAEG